VREDIRTFSFILKEAGIQQERLRLAASRKAGETFDTLKHTQSLPIHSKIKIEKQRKRRTAISSRRERNGYKQQDSLATTPSQLRSSSHVLYLYPKLFILASKVKMKLLDFQGAFSELKAKSTPS
jgi:hypothetical protein